MPILDPEGNFATRTYRADTTLIYKMPNKQIQVGDPAKSNKIIEKPKPIDNMPILDPEGNFATRTYRTDTTLIYKMPVKGFNADKLKKNYNK
ncbi:hypothetical protein EIM50_20435 [Pseudoxanthomonas sp. SGD-10]|nr:hypothetical protein EIM50_20435 [Pseudoxanthomonas sp. SGD-10]